MKYLLLLVVVAKAFADTPAPEPVKQKPKKEVKCDQGPDEIRIVEKHYIDRTKKNRLLVTVQNKVVGADGSTTTSTVPGGVSGTAYSQSKNGLVIGIQYIRDIADHADLLLGVDAQGSVTVGAGINF